MTYSTSQASLFADESTSLPEDSPASHSAPQESEKEEMMSDISSPKCFGLFERLNPDSWWQRTFVDCLVSNLDEYSPKLSHRWSAKVSRSLHFVFLLAPSAPRTDEIASGLLRTPSASEPGVKTERLQTKDGEPAKIGERAYDKRNGRLAQVGLSQQIQMLPTPRAKNIELGKVEVNEEGRRISTNGEHYSLSLGERIAMIPTPRTRGLLGGSGSKQMMQDQVNAGNISAEDASGLMGVELLPTIGSASKKGGGITQLGGGSAGKQKFQKMWDARLGENHGLRLHPDFVEWMMGYPIGHTVSSASETV